MQALTSFNIKNKNISVLAVKGLAARVNRGPKSLAKSILAPSDVRGEPLFFMHSGNPYKRFRSWPIPARTQPYPVGDATPQAIIPLLQASFNRDPLFYKSASPSLQVFKTRAMSIPR